MRNCDPGTVEDKAAACLTGDTAQLLDYVSLVQLGWSIEGGVDQRSQPGKSRIDLQWIVYLDHRCVRQESFIHLGRDAPNVCSNRGAVRPKGLRCGGTFRENVLIGEQPRGFGSICLPADQKGANGSHAGKRTEVVHGKNHVSRLQDEGLWRQVYTRHLPEGWRDHGFHFYSRNQFCDPFLDTVQIGWRLDEKGEYKSIFVLMPAIAMPAA